LPSVSTTGSPRTMTAMPRLHANMRRSLPIWRSCAPSCRLRYQLRPPAMSNSTRARSKRLTASSGATIVPRLRSPGKSRGIAAPADRPARLANQLDSDRAIFRRDILQSSGAGARAFQNARLQKKLMKQADAVLSAAAAAYGQGKYAKTEALCREILKALPNHVDAMHLLGMCAHDGRRYEEAKELLEHVIALDPRLHDAHNNLATVHFDLGNYEEARRCQERAIALKPN